MQRRTEEGDGRVRLRTSSLPLRSGRLDRRPLVRDSPGSKDVGREGEGQWLDGMVKDGNRGVRSVARGLALVLIAGAMLAALNDTGFGRMLRNAVGYADFGYVPAGVRDLDAHRRAPSTATRCACARTPGARRRSCFVGHECVPDRRRHRRACTSRCPTRATCSRSAPGLGRGRPVATVHPADVRQRARGQPDQCLRQLLGLGRRLAATSTSRRPSRIARSAQRLHADVRRSRTPAGSTQTDPSARLVLVLRLRHRRRGRPAPPPRWLQVRSPTWAARSRSARPPTAARPRSSASPRATGSARIAATTPAAAALDNQLHQDRRRGRRAERRWRWPGRCARWRPARRRRYSVDGRAARSRASCSIGLAGAAPTGDAPTRARGDGSIEDRPLAGRFVRWRVLRGPAARPAAAPIDADKRATFDDPGRGRGAATSAPTSTPTATALQDERRAGPTSGTIFAPAAAPARRDADARRRPRRPAADRPAVTPTRVVVTLGVRSSTRAASARWLGQGRPAQARPSPRSVRRGARARRFSKRNARGKVSA